MSSIKPNPDFGCQPSSCRAFSLEARFPTSINLAMNAPQIASASERETLFVGTPTAAPMASARAWSGISVSVEPLKMHSLHEIDRMKVATARSQ